MFRGLVLVAVLILISNSAYSMSCINVFSPSVRLISTSSVAKSENSGVTPERELSGKTIKMLTEQRIVESDIELKKLRKLLEDNPFLYEALENTAQSYKHLEEIVTKNLRLQSRAVEMAFASGSSQRYEATNQQVTKKKSQSFNSKVVDLSEVRAQKEKQETELMNQKLEEEKADYEAFLSKTYSLDNYGFFHEIHYFFTILKLKIYNSPTVLKLTSNEVEGLKEVANNFEIYSNYLLAKEILNNFSSSNASKATKNELYKLTTVLTRSAELKGKFMEYLSFIDKALETQRHEEVLDSPAVERVQKQLFKEVDEVHLEGSEKRFSEAVQYLESRLTN